MNFWDNKFNQEHYIYGESPNKFFKNKIDNLKPSNIFLPGDGEGRNSVYASTKGWDVFVIDSSEVGKKKALSLAQKYNININYKIQTVEDYKVGNKYNCIALVFLHLMPESRVVFHKKLLDSLNKDATLICEFFSKKQIDKSSGGPSNIEMLYDKELLLSDFGDLDILELYETEEILDEGPTHKGKASLIRLVATKKY